MKMRITSLLLLLSLGCTVDTNSDLPGPLWDTDVVATTDGLYVALPHAGSLARVTNDGKYDIIDLNVGGTRFSTSRQTLLSDPDSMLALTDATGTAIIASGSVAGIWRMP